MSFRWILYILKLWTCVCIQLFHFRYLCYFSCFFSLWFLVFLLIIFFSFLFPPLSVLLRTLFLLFDGYPGHLGIHIQVFKMQNWSVLYYSFWIVQKPWNIFTPLYSLLISIPLFSGNLDLFLICKNTRHYYDFCLDLSKYLFFFFINIVYIRGHQSVIIYLPPKYFFFPYKISLVGMCWRQTPSGFLSEKAFIFLTL